MAGQSPAMTNERLSSPDDFSDVITGLVPVIPLRKAKCLHN
jgi:hypothetical protein